MYRGGGFRRDQERCAGQCCSRRTGPTFTAGSFNIGLERVIGDAYGEGWIDMLCKAA
jgi:hypothetical protein